MAAPSYTEDLTDISLMESTTGVSAYGGGASGLAVNPDSSMQGTNGIGKQITAADKGMYYDNGSGITLGTGEHVFVWLFCTTPGLTDTIQNKGVSILVGTSGSAYCQYHTDGNDTYGAVGRVGKCYPIDYSVRSTNGSSPYRTATGSPGANPQVFGGGLVTTSSVKGENLVVDAIRRGTGAYLTAGELISAGDGSDNPCTFTGFRAQNDAVANRWAILTQVGAGFELQGRFVIGQNNSQTPTLCRFQASDTRIDIVDTIHAAADFTQIIVDHASTVCNLTNINITALGTTNRGRFIVNSANPTVNVTGGAWTGIGITTLRSNSTMNGLTWRQAGQITLNGATLTDCIIDRTFASSAVVASTLANITGCTFVSDGSSHAVELTSIGGGTMTWDNTLSGYETGASGSPVTPTSTGNEAIYVNVGSGTLTINVADGASIPSIRSAGATVNVVAGLKTFTFTISPSFTGYEWRIYTVTAVGSLAGATEIAGEESASQDNQSYSYSYSGDQAIGVQIIAVDEDYEESITFYTLKNADQSVTINLTEDLNN